MSENKIMNTQENSAQDNVDIQTLVAPLNLWLQWHGDGDPNDESEVCEGEVTWGRDKIFDADLEYVSANEIRHALKGHHCSELWGDDGLISATMRCVDALERIGDLVTTDYETKETFIRRVRRVLGLNV